MYLLYTFLLGVYGVALLPVFVWRWLRHGKYGTGWRERCGRLPLSFNPERHASMWIHAVSVGEALAARPLIDALRHAYPGLRLFVSTTTLTGRRVAMERLTGVDGVFFFPFDFPSFVERALETVNPKLFVTIDTEIWPNLLRVCRRRGVKTAILNARMSRRSYPRYRLARPFFRRVLETVDRIGVQTDQWRAQFLQLGAPPARVVVTGSLKFDALDASASATSEPHGDVLRFFRRPTGHPVLIAASTLRGEEGPVLEAFRTILGKAPDSLLIIAPRHPERFAEAYDAAARAGFRVSRRSELAIDAPPGSEVVVLDTIGELARLYRLATVVFVGGSLVDAGGHNILEPALFGKPIIFGPHMDNFAEIAELFLTHDAACQIQSSQELSGLVAALVADPARRARLGASAQALVDAHRGATERSLGIIGELLPREGRESGADTSG